MRALFFNSAQLRQVRAHRALVGVTPLSILPVDIPISTCLVNTRRTTMCRSLVALSFALLYAIVRNQRGQDARSEVWTPQELYQDPELFSSRIKASLPLRPSITMQYLFMTPPGTSPTVGGPVLLMQRHYSMYYRTGVKKVMSFTTKPFGSLASGVFFSRSHAVGYAELQRAGGASFANEGVLAAMETLARDVEKAREIGDTMAVHASLLPLALVSGVNGDALWAVRAAVDVARVTKSAAARHRSLRHLCDSVREILRQLISWVRSTDTMLKWESDDEDDDEVDTFNEVESQTALDQTKFRNDHSRSAMDLFKKWLEAAHRLFWGWRREVVMYLDADDYSDVMVVKDKVRVWITEISHPDTMGLRLPTLRWHGNRRAIADGKEVFLESATATEHRLSSLSGWLHCLDLSLAWDAARICDRVHRLHLDEAGIGDAGREANPRSQMKDSKPNGRVPPSLVGKGSFALPTSTCLLRLQRVWLDDIAALAVDDDNTVVKHKNGRRGEEKTRKTKAAPAEGVRYEPAPVTPDSKAAPQGLDVRLAILQTLREDLAPEALAHEMTLIRYATENRIDESLHAAITSLVTSILSRNPFPSLTNALAPISTKQLLWREADPDVTIRPPSPKAWLKKNDRVADVDGRSQVCIAMGTRQIRRGVFGLRPALVGINVDEMLTLFDMLPPVQLWAQDAAERWENGGGGELSIAVMGIDRSVPLPGPYTHHSVPSEVAVVVLCAFDYDVNTDNTAEKAFAHLVVHCTMEAQKTSSSLVVLNLGFKSSTNGNDGAEFEKDVDRVFSPREILDEHEHTKREVAQSSPNEIVMRALIKHSIPDERGGRRSLWVPFTLRFVLLAEGEEGSERGENAEAHVLYDCVYLTEHAAEGVATQLSGLVEPELHQRHIQRLGLMAVQHAGEMDYLEAYRSLLRLRRIRHFICENSDEKSVLTRSSVVVSDEVEPRDNESENGSKLDVHVDAGIARMLRGPVGRLHHAQCMLNVLERVLSGAEIPSEALSELREGKTLRQHAAYTIQYLLDCLAERSPVRLEGAVESVKLRARLLLDEVTKISRGKAVEKQQESNGGTCRRQHACRLCRDVLSLLEIVHAAVQADFHLCCPEIEHVLDEFRIEIKHRKQTQKESAMSFVACDALPRGPSYRPSYNAHAGEIVGIKTSGAGV